VRVVISGTPHPKQEVRVKHRLVVLAALGVLSACGTVQEDSKVTPPLQDPVTKALYCEVCPIAPEQVESMTRAPLTDSVTGQVYCPPPCGGYCGDGICGYGEDSYNCPWDCGATPYCGDGICNGGESCSSCSADCGSCGGYCGDGVCNGGESCSSCSADCGWCGGYCGDGICEYPETFFNCRIDCNYCFQEVCP
jgi:hypothetical protein